MNTHLAASLKQLRLPGMRENFSIRLIEAQAAQLGHELGLQINAGHGLTIANLPDLFTVPHLHELNIGHSIISRSLTVGLFTAVAEMKALCGEYHAS